MQKKRIVFLIISLIIVFCAITLLLYSKKKVISYESQEKEILNIDSFSVIQNEVNKILSEYFNGDIEEKNIQISLQQLDNDENMEIVVLIREQYDFKKPNFLIIDKVNDEYIEVFKKERIHNFNIYNNSILVLSTDMISPGTGISESYYYAYLNINNKFTEVFSNYKELIHVYENGEVLEILNGKINFINNTLHYNVNSFTKNKGEERYKKEEIYELYDNKFNLLEKKEF